MLFQEEYFPIYSDSVLPLAWEHGHGSSSLGVFPSRDGTLIQRPDFDFGGAAALVTLGGHDHVVPGTELQVALAAPFLEVLARVDRAADALLATDGPVLVEGSGADDGRLVDTPGAVDVVHAAIVLDGAEARRAGRRVVRAVGLDNVVLDERVGGPAVEREIYGRG